jgi:hypothetical protein
MYFVHLPICFFPPPDIFSSFSNTWNFFSTNPGDHLVCSPDVFFQPPGHFSPRASFLFLEIRLAREFGQENLCLLSL